MSMISFGHTTPPFVNKMKTVTRRHWKPKYAEQFGAGDIVDAWSQIPIAGGRKIGRIRLTDHPYLERTGVHRSPSVLEAKEKLDAFYIAEGFAYLDKRWGEITDDVTMPLYMKAMNWIIDNQELWVVPFEIIEVFPGMRERFSTDEEIIRCVDKLIEVLP